MLPGEFLGSRNCKEFVEKCIKSDFLLTIKNIRQGKRYVAPCASIYSVLASFGKLSESHLPFGFYRSFRTVGVISQRQMDEPLVSIKLKGPKTVKELFLVRYNFCIIFIGTGHCISKKSKRRFVKTGAHQIYFLGTLISCEVVFSLYKSLQQGLRHIFSSRPKRKFSPHLMSISTTRSVLQKKMKHFSKYLVHSGLISFTYPTKS